MGTPHKHRDVIIAWANGEEVQRKSIHDLDWADSKNPNFSIYSEYRIKPKRVKKEGWVNVYPDGYGYLKPTKEEADKKACDARVACIRIEWEQDA